MHHHLHKEGVAVKNLHQLPLRLNHLNQESLKVLLITPSDKNLEKKILKKIKKTQISENESAQANLIQLTKDIPDHYRVSLCTPRILAALIPMPQSPNAIISVNSTEALYTFSLSLSHRI